MIRLLRKGKIEGIYDGVEWLIDPQTLDDFARRYLRKGVNPEAANKDKGNETPAAKGSMKIFLSSMVISAAVAALTTMVVMAGEVILLDNVVNKAPEQGTPAGVVAEMGWGIPYEVAITPLTITAIPATGSHTVNNAVKATVYYPGVYSITMSIMNVDQLKRYYDYMIIVFETDDDGAHTVDRPGVNSQLMALTLDNPTDTTLFYAAHPGDVLLADAAIYWDAQDVPHSKVPILLKVLIEAH
ncbi:hypothetical protein M1N86_01385 [Dehalococcoidia bacterium]|nr:hypothetical protein [Dehalococcoidia bacterium]